MLASCSDPKFKLPLGTLCADIPKDEGSCNDTNAFCKLQLGLFATTSPFVLHCYQERRAR